MEKDEAMALFARTYFGETDSGILSVLSRFCRLRHFSRNEFIFHQQQHGETAYFLATGSVKLFRINSSGKEVAITFVSVGQLIAWLALQFDDFYPVSAVCLKASTLLAFDVRHTENLLALSPQLTRRMLSYFARRHRSYLNSIQALALSEPKQRLVNYLNELSRQEGSETIRLPVAKKQIALLLGITPETLSRILRQLSDERFIAVQGRDIRLIKHHA